MTSPGFGWRLVAFDGSTRRGEVAFGACRLRFESEAAGDEDLRVGDDVFVRLFPPSDAPHVARVWPCVARLRVPADVGCENAPELPDEIAAAAASTLARVAVPVELYPVDRGDGRLALVAASVDENTYGIAGKDIAVHGAVVCETARPGVNVAITAARARLALSEERALVHATAPLGAREIVVTLASARDEFSPDAPGRVVLVTCESLSWEPAPTSERSAAAERALASIAGFAFDVSTIVDGSGLVATLRGRSERFFELADDEVAAFTVWCEGVNAALGAARDED